MKLAQAPAPTPSEIIHSDVGYTGATVDESSLGRFADPDYYRDKIREFQAQLNALAATGDEMLALRDQATDPGLISDLDAWLADFYDNKPRLLLAAEAVNGTAATANAVGLRMPELSVPQQLAQWQPVMIAAVAAAGAGMLWAISYAVGKISDARAVIARQATIALLPESDRAAALAADQKIQLAQANAASVLGGIAGILKWIALGVAVYFGFRALRQAEVL